MFLRYVSLALCCVGALSGIALLGLGVAPVRPERSAPAPRSMTMLAVESSRMPVESMQEQTTRFWIDALEVSVADFELCVRAGACHWYATASDPSETAESRERMSYACNAARPDRASQRMNCLDASQADAYCRWQGKYLPTAQQWLTAMATVAPDHPESLHRRGGEPTARISYYKRVPSEWTSSATAPPHEAPSLSLRSICWHAPVEPMRQAPSNPPCSFQVITTRTPWVGFRCARGESR